MTTASDMRAVVAALQALNFTAAGVELGLTGSAVAKLVTRAEQHLGVRLLHRSTRRLVLTAEGETYLSRARRILAEIDDLEAGLADAKDAPRGRLRVACANMFGTTALIPALPDFMARFPEVEIELHVSDGRADLAGGAVDIAIRRGVVTEAGFVVRKLRDDIRLCVAAPRYLTRYGTPEVPADLLGHECIYPAGVPDLDLWPFPAAGGSGRLRVAGRARIDNALALLAAARAGLGIAMISEYQAADPIRRGELIRLLEAYQLEDPVPLSLLMPAGRQRPARVSAFVAFCVERFGQRGLFSGRVKGG